MRCRTVLCVDDDAAILDSYGVLLGRNGYRVIAAVDGVHALRVVRSKSKDIDAVILDYEMPKMNGLELAVMLKRRDPQLPIVMIAGRLPVSHELAPFVDAAMKKGVPIDSILNQLEHLLASRPVMR